MNTVFVVLWLNYGDQGVEFMGVFGTIERAEVFIADRISSSRYPPGIETRDDYHIVESPVQ